MAQQIKSLYARNEAGELIELDASAFLYFLLTTKGNIQITSPSGGKINIESEDNIALKPVGKVQFDTNHQLDSEGAAKPDEFEVAVINDKKSKVEGLKINTAGLKFVTEGADSDNGWDANLFKMLFKKTTGSTDTYAKVNMHGASFDLRARSTGKGTGGGIAVQIAGVDSDVHANKFKIETDQIADVTTEQCEEIHCGEGGKGIEIGTINPLMTSLYTASYRFKFDAPLYGVTRGAVQAIGDKMDYPTQADDSKDIINEDQEADPLTLKKLYRLYWWAISEGFNPNSEDKYFRPSFPEEGEEEPED